jgi:hypothetical protein
MGSRREALIAGKSPAIGPTKTWKPPSGCLIYLRERKLRASTNVITWSLLIYSWRSFERQLCLPGELPESMPQAISQQFNSGINSSDNITQIDILMNP